MENTTYIAISRQAVLERQLETVANNLANMNTTAFKSQSMMFVDHLVKSRGGERMLPEPLHFVRDLATYRDFAAGPIQSTGNPLDVAIDGEGYFVVDTPDGERYTRCGRFHLDNQGRIVTSAGYPVLSDNGQPFTIPNTATGIDIGHDGTVSTEGAATNESIVMGRLRIVSFPEGSQPRETFGGLYEGDDAPTSVDNPQVVQNALEGSNVNPILELTRMIDVQRSYEGARKLIDAEDDRMKKMIGELARVAA